MSLEPVERPNGKLYRPRLIRAHMIDDEDHWPFVVVLGTHDKKVALPVAQKELDQNENGLLARPICPVWYRLTISNYETCWIWDDVRGAAGVLFATEEA